LTDRLRCELIGTGTKGALPARRRIFPKSEAKMRFRFRNTRGAIAAICSQMPEKAAKMGCGCALEPVPISLQRKLIGKNGL
jgi:hypothetical protein